MHKNTHEKNAAQENFHQGLSVCLVIKVLPAFPSFRYTVFRPKVGPTPVQKFVPRIDRVQKRNPALLLLLYSKVNRGLGGEDFQNRHAKLVGNKSPITSKR